MAYFCFHQSDEEFFLLSIPITNESRYVSILEIPAPLDVCLVVTSASSPTYISRRMILLYEMQLITKVLSGAKQLAPS